MAFTLQQVKQHTGALVQEVFGAALCTTNMQEFTDAVNAVDAIMESTPNANVTAGDGAAKIKNIIGTDMNAISAAYNGATGTQLALKALAFAQWARLKRLEMLGTL